MVEIQGMNDGVDDDYYYDDQVVIDKYYLRNWDDNSPGGRGGFNFQLGRTWERLDVEGTYNRGEMCPTSRIKYVDDHFDDVGGDNDWRQSFRFRLG